MGAAQLGQRTVARPRIATVVPVTLPIQPRRHARRLGGQNDCLDLLEPAVAS